MTIIYNDNLTATINGKLHDVTPQKCSFTDEPLLEGFHVGEYIVADSCIAQNLAIEKLQQDGCDYESWDELAADYDDAGDWFYWTQWDTIDDVFYDEEGNKYQFNSITDQWEKL